MRLIFSALAVLFLTAPATAQQQLGADCNGVFNRNASHQDMVKAFGARNVAFREVKGPEGPEHATVIFPNQRQKRVEITWNNEAGRTKPYFITVHAPSNWVWPFGITTQTTIQGLEQLAGGPFQLMESEGRILASLGGTKLEQHPSGCSIHIVFKFGVSERDPRFGRLFTNAASSNSPQFLQLKPRIGSLTIYYN